jgi:hypothetical protein
MSSFEVVPDDLQSLAANIAGLVGDIMQASSRIGTSAGGVAQNAELDSAIGEFVHGWGSGLEDMQHNLASVASKLAGAAGAYSGAEDGLARGFGAG